MSHKATNWAINQRGLKPATKLVLWHLCDRHHPDHGCFPSQETLADDCEMSRSTLNLHLKTLVSLGFVRRAKRFDGKSHRQQSTVYEFPFEFPGGVFPTPENGDGGGDNPNKARGQNGEPSPEFGDGNDPKPCPKSGHGSDPKPCPTDRTRGRVRKTPKAVSEKHPKPCPNVRTLTSKEPVNNPRVHTCARGAASFFTADERSEAREIADHIRSGGQIDPSGVRQRLRRCLIETELITEAEAEKAGLA